MLTLLFTLAQKQTPSKFHLVGVALKLHDVLNLLRDLTHVTTVSSILNALGEALVSFKALAAHLAATYTAKVTLAVANTEIWKPPDLHYPSTSIDSIHLALVATLSFGMFVFAVFMYVLRKQ